MMSFTMNMYALEDIVSTAITCGMEAIDWIGLHGCRAEYLKKVCDDAGLHIASHTMFKDGFLYDKRSSFDEFKSSMDDAHTLGAPIMMIPPFARYNQTSRDDDRKRYTEYYARCCEYAKGSGVTLTLESTGYHNSPITTADECLEVLSQVPDLRLTFDQGNVASAENPIEAYKKLRQYVVHFHLKDWYVFDEPHEKAEKKRCGKYFADAIIGQGNMDLKSFWQEVSQEERQLYVNPETWDRSGKWDSVGFFTPVCAAMRSWED